MKGTKPMAHDNLLDRYNCGPVKFSGGDNALYERHLTFDHVIPVSSATPCDKFEAIARSIRDVLSQRWRGTFGKPALKLCLTKAMLDQRNLLSLVRACEWSSSHGCFPAHYPLPPSQ